MSTKQNPGAFDCYAKLKDDEPYFVLKATDQSAPFIVEQWARNYSARPGKFNSDKVQEAMEVAQQMRAWYRKNMSAQACGCDPGAKYQCEAHRDSGRA
jgi:hypothetical protein